MPYFKSITFILFILAFLFYIPTRVLALTVPTFPSCNSPQGSVIASFDSGAHGVVGDGRTLTGSDRVYQLSDSTFLQCLCSPETNGIQSNWLDANGLSQSDIQILKSEGWLWVPDGSLWGLKNDSYLVQNISYSCTGVGGSNSSNGGGGGTGGPGGGETAGTSTSIGEILGLATTGNQLKIALLLITSMALLALSIITYRKWQS